MSTVWAIPASAAHPRRILTFLKDARCSVRAVEVKLFKYDSLYKRTPLATRRWEPSRDLSKIAEEIATYISNNGSPEATLVATDEVYRVRAPHLGARVPRPQPPPTRRR
jgi:hypothetical protein